PRVGGGDEREPAGGLARQLARRPPGVAVARGAREPHARVPGQELHQLEAGVAGGAQQRDVGMRSLHKYASYWISRRRASGGRHARPSVGLVLQVLAGAPPGLAEVAAGLLALLPGALAGVAGALAGVADALTEVLGRLLRLVGDVLDLVL